MSASTSIYRRVLIPIDLTPGSQAKAPAVRRIIDTRDTEITLLHVVDAKPWSGRAGQTLRLMNELEILAQRQYRGAGLVRRIEWGRPADCILGVLRSGGADLVLMTAAPVGADPIGPVADEVLAEAPRPVLLDWPATHPTNQALVQPVCCALEWDGNEARVIREAARVAQCCAAPLMVLGVAARERDAAALRARAGEFLRRVAPDAELRVEAGFPGALIRRALRLHGAGLLVAGGSRDVLLAAEGECAVLYVGRQEQSVTMEFEFAERRSA
jgi:nucleotide-binding universal stress UspA family protein